MKRRWILGGALTWVMAGIIFAKPGTLVTSDGKRYEGDISERNDQYVVNIHGVDTAINRADVISLNYTEAADKEFANRMAGLKATMWLAESSWHDGRSTAGNMLWHERRWILL